ncbi:LytTR family DNA-binding domain-containing protein [Microvirga zambiensis]|uniref:LytTR family DNA-binding domain-containing protein n=1 Tax=Microvirga zambiensis TaxID=1402137 RepID=UPI00191FE284|nr:LytTR family DNA-binding domain-containing protein [Microvirga zambiensis]
MTQRQRLFSGKLRLLLAAILVGLLLGFAGPFGSYPALPILTRYIYWLGLTVAGVMTAAAVDAVLPSTRLRSRARRIGAVALVSALPMTFVVTWAISLVQPGRFFTPQQLPALFAAVATVQLLIVYVITITTPTVDNGAAPDRQLPLPERSGEAATPVLPSPLLVRLPPGLGSEVIALETEDHYLRVHTSAGSALILMRMADAVALLDPRLGAQVHRRWWVAERAVAHMQRDGQKLCLGLTNGIVVPVGRTFSGMARARFACARRIDSSQADEVPL